MGYCGKGRGDGSDLGNGLDCCHSNAPGLTQGAVVQVGQHCSHQRFPQCLQVDQRHATFDTHNLAAGGMVRGLGGAGRTGGGLEIRASTVRGVSEGPCGLVSRAGKSPRCFN